MCLQVFVVVHLSISSVESKVAVEFSMNDGCYSDLMSRGMIGWHRGCACTLERAAIQRNSPQASSQSNLLLKENRLA